MHRPVRAFLIVLAISLGFQACGEKSGSDPNQPIPVETQSPAPAPLPAPEPATELAGPETPTAVVRSNCDDLEDGKSVVRKFYKKEFAAFGETCESLAFEGTLTCDDGKLNLPEKASLGCEETQIKDLKIVGTAGAEIGQSLALSLTAKDQRGAEVTIDPKLAIWKSANDLLRVSESGVVNADIEVQKVTVTAQVGTLKAETTVTFSGKSCGDLSSGASRKFDKFSAERVAFGMECQAQAVMGLCKNGEIHFAVPVFDHCETAKIVSLNAEPKSLFLNNGESTKVDLVLLDDLGNRFELEETEATWTIPNGAPVSVSGGKVKATARIAEKIEIQIEAKGFKSTVSVSAGLAAPEILGFAFKDLLLKVGDERDLEVKATAAIEPKDLNWSSSDPSVVSIENGHIKALKAGGTATISASLDGKTLSLPVSVENQLTLKVIPVSYDANQEGKAAALTQDRVSLLPAFTAEIQGMEKDQLPQFESVTEGCKFSARLGRHFWEVSSEIDETRADIPRACEANLILETPAGQKLNEHLSVPVDYNKVSLTESSPVEREGGLEVAVVHYKFSESYSVKSANVQALAAGKCDLEIVPEDHGYRIVYKGPKDSVCAGRFVLKMLDANDNLVLTYDDLVVVSAAKPFLNLCQEAQGAAKNTVSAIRKLLGPSIPCDELAPFVRKKSLDVLGSKKSFALNLANSRLIDLSPLARFLGLTELDLAFNRELTDISPLKDLKQLKALNLKFSKVVDFLPIFGQRQMTDLRLPENSKLVCSSEIFNPELKKICQ